MFELKREFWGIYKGQEVFKFSITEKKSGFSVAITNLGATLLRVQVPDRYNEVKDVLYGRSSIKEFEQNDKAYFGATVGRVASIIGFGTFILDGHKYELSKNLMGVHHMHGGKEGFSYKVFKPFETNTKLFDQINAAPNNNHNHNNNNNNKAIDNIANADKQVLKEHFKNYKEYSIDTDLNEVKLTFQYTSPDGEEGYPGELDLFVTYIISDMTLGWEYRAFSKKPTLVNLTNHGYWNLDGVHKTIDNLSLKVPSSRYIKLNMGKVVSMSLLKKIKVLHGEKTLPFEIRSTASDGINLAEPRMFKEIFKNFGQLDNIFLLDDFKDNIFDELLGLDVEMDANSNPKIGPEFKKKHDELVNKLLFTAAELYSQERDLKMVIKTTEPALTIYTGNSMAGLVIMGKKCVKHGAVCLEAMRPSDAIHIRDFKKYIILRPGRMYFQKTIHEFIR
ncbi:MAG: aldose epimerase family protein [Promethearchaeota archaeon]